MSESLYFIALVPPAEVQLRIDRLKHEMADKFDSRHPLNSPSHITLHMPFRWKDSKRPILTELINRINGSFSPFTIQLDGFDFFEPRVIYVNVIHSESLTGIQKTVQNECRMALKKVNANYRDQVFHPHITIGFRDLKKAKFYEARDYYSAQRFSEKFEVNEVSLLRHDGAKWQIDDLK